MRFYKNDMPKIDDIVMCHVEKIQDYCIYVKLVEYDNVQGLVQLSDASTRRKRKSVCLLKVNKKYPLLVIRVDEEKRYIDLSNKFLSEEDKEIANKKYNNYFFTIKLLKSFLSKKFEGKYNEDQFIEYAEKTVWKIEPRKCYDYIIDNYIKKSSFNEFSIDDTDKELFKLIVQNSLGEVIFKSNLSFMARSLSFEGVLKLKSIFEQINKKYNLLVMVDVSPNYYLVIESDNSDNNEETLAEIERVLEKLFLENNCMYKKIGITTTNNLN